MDIYIQQDREDVAVQYQKIIKDFVMNFRFLNGQLYHNSSYLRKYVESSKRHLDRLKNEKDKNNTVKSICQSEVVDEDIEESNHNC